MAVGISCTVGSGCVVPWVWGLLLHATIETKMSAAETPISIDLENLLVIQRIRLRDDAVNAVKFGLAGNARIVMTLLRAVRSLQLARPTPRLAGSFVQNQLTGLYTITRMIQVAIMRPYCVIHHIIRPRTLYYQPVRRQDTANSVCSGPENVQPLCARNVDNDYKTAPL